jgi:hypothetical protein
VAVFELLGIPLVHGWLVDPKDARTAAVFGNKSYNELVEMLFLVGVGLVRLGSLGYTVQGIVCEGARYGSCCCFGTLHAPCTSTAAVFGNKSYNELVEMLFLVGVGLARPGLWGFRAFWASRMGFTVQGFGCVCFWLCLGARS